MVSYETVRWLLYNNNGDPTELLRLYPDFVPTMTKSNGFPYLHYACIKNHVVCVRGLIKCGVDLKWKNAQGFTPLFYACWHPSRIRTPEIIHKQYQLLQWMLTIHDVRSTINWNDNIFKVTPLQIVLEHCDNSKIIILLLNNGADPTIYDLNARRHVHISPINEEVIMIASQIWNADSWRPWNHSEYPPTYRKAMCTLVTLARSTIVQ